MPPRTTQQSDRPRVSDRTMVGTLPPCCLEALRLGQDERRFDGSEFSGPGALTTLRNRLRSCSQGLDVGNSSPSNAEGEVFFLDIPFYRTRRKLKKKTPQPMSAVSKRTWKTERPYSQVSLPPLESLGFFTDSPANERTTRPPWPRTV
jgi:hypothetical protein